MAGATGAIVGTGVGDGFGAPVVVSGFAVRGGDGRPTTPDAPPDAPPDARQEAASSAVIAT